MVCVRKAVQSDLGQLKALVDRYRYELGFVLRPALLESIRRNEVFVAVSDELVLGLVEYHHRRDERTTIYHIVVVENRRRQGIGSQLLTALREESFSRKKREILLKCPFDLPANVFYAEMGFQLATSETGRTRKLNVWKITLQPPAGTVADEIPSIS